jgi:hypothetical protein
MFKGMYVLGRPQPADSCGAVAVHSGVFSCNEGSLRVQDSLEELGCVVHVNVAIGVTVQPNHTCVAEKGAGWLADHQVKPRVEEVGGIADDVGHGGVLRWHAVDGDYVTSGSSERVGHDRCGVAHGQYARSAVPGTINRMFDSLRKQM